MFKIGMLRRHLSICLIRGTVFRRQYCGRGGAKWFRVPRPIGSHPLLFPICLKDHFFCKARLRHIRTIKCDAQSRHFLKFNLSTIYALSSGYGKCGVAVIRVSGPQSRTVLDKLCHLVQIQPRKTVLTRICDPETTEVLDKGLVVYFPAPNSFTGEDCCELHIHGGVAVISAVLAALESLPGLRHAEAGEFTKRAFQNGKLDLTEVEGLSDLIHAETEQQRKQALRQMQGELSQLYTRWRKQLMKCVADVEAFIDFSEDENIEEGILDDVQVGIQSLIGSIDQHLNDKRQGERLRDGVHVAIIGKPNVGKSSLLNIICQRPAAIVSPIAGTTRDVVETALNINGFPVLLSDTAGLRESQDQVEMEGIRRAVQRGEQADLQVIVLDAPELAEDHHLKTVASQDHFVKTYLSHLGFVNSDPHQERLIVVNKIDLSNGMDSMPNFMKHGTCHVSCKTGDGLDNLLTIISEKVKEMCANPSSGNPSLTQARHRVCLVNCLTALEEYMHVQEADIVIGAQELRKGLRQLGKITGKITTEEILGVIFKDFCIGK